MPRRRLPPTSSDQPELDLSRPPAPAKRRRTDADIAETARVAIARRSQPADASGTKVRLTLTIVLSRKQAERLSARAIREERNLKGVVSEILERTSE